MGETALSERTTPNANAEPNTTVLNSGHCCTYEKVRYLYGAAASIYKLPSLNAGKSRGPPSAQPRPKPSNRRQTYLGGQDVFPPPPCTLKSISVPSPQRRPATYFTPMFYSRTPSPSPQRLLLPRPPLLLRRLPHLAPRSTIRWLPWLRSRRPSFLSCLVSLVSLTPGLFEPVDRSAESRTGQHGRESPQRRNGTVW